MIRDRYRDVREVIRKKLRDEPHVKGYFPMMLIPIIIGKYFYYANQAVLNGYPISIPQANCKIMLEQEPVRNLKPEEVGMYFKSNRVFGKMFSIKMKGKNINPNFSFYPHKKLTEPLQKILDSDIIYELIKE